MVVTLILPSVLFTVFLDLEFKSSYLAIFLVVGAICVGLYFLGRLLVARLATRPSFCAIPADRLRIWHARRLPVRRCLWLEAVGYIAIVDLAHELFIWFIFAPLLMIKRDGASDVRTILKMFQRRRSCWLSSAGLILNALGLSEMIKTTPVLSSIHKTMMLVATMVIPLILIIVGHGIKISRDGLKEVLLITGLRYGLIVPLALLINHFVIGAMMGLGQPFKAALFTLLVLPPPFIIPLFMQKASEEERASSPTHWPSRRWSRLAIFSAYLAFNPSL